MIKRGEGSGGGNDQALALALALALARAFPPSSHYYCHRSCFRCPCPLAAFAHQEKYTEEEARKVVHKLAGAIKYCHDMGIVHRDLKVGGFRPGLLPRL